MSPRYPETPPSTMCRSSIDITSLSQDVARIIEEELKDQDEQPDPTLVAEVKGCLKVIDKDRDGRLNREELVVALYRHIQRHDIEKEKALAAKKQASWWKKIGIG